MTSKPSGNLAAKRTHIVVAGHICLDIIPEFETAQSVRPGMLLSVGPSHFATGGSVANTGVALHRLGAKVQLAARVGDDMFGQEVLRLIKDEGRHLSRRIRVVKGGVTSYSIVISPPGVDRSFFHCSGENDRFSPSDLTSIEWDRTAIFHFGYPPMMRGMYDQHGRELARVFSLARRRGAMTSLDMCMPDLNSASGQVDWHRVCETVLPKVDLFCPSVDELLFMLNPKAFRQATRGKPALAASVTTAMLRTAANECLAMGARAVLIKLGDRGLYLRTSSNGLRSASNSAWNDVEMHCPCRAVNVVGTTGSGDCTIAGFLFAMLRQKSPSEAMTWATAVGATCCEAADATSAITDWSLIEQRLARGWPPLRRPLRAR